MAGINSVVEEKVKYRDGKKWKSRWCVLKKPSPVADCLHVKLYKCVKDALKGDKPKHDFFLEEFYGLETGFTYDKELHVLAILCHKQITVFSFDTRDTLIKFEIKIRHAIGEDHKFPVTVKVVPQQSKIPTIRMRMHIHGQRFCLTSHYPPKIQATWNITELRSFGKSDNKFILHGGSKEGKVGGVHVFETQHAEEIEEIIQLASHGKPTNYNKKNSRRSQNCDYLDPVCRSNMSLYKGSLPSSPSTTYRHKEWRHSFTASNSWSASQSSQLMSIENFERDKIRSNYDVPPSPTRRVENSRSKQNNCDKNNKNSQGQHVGENKVTNCYHGNQSVPQAWTNEVSEIQPGNLTSNASVSASAPALCGYGAYSLFSTNRNISSSVPNSIDEMEEVDHRERLDCLQQEESDLQREISLLDEMLHGCKAGRKGYNQRDRNKPPPIPRKNVSSRNSTKRPGNLSLPNSPPQSHKEYNSHSPNSLLSPNLFSKLKGISSNSKLSAPLPYVNLEKYDLGDVDNGHVDVPRSPGCADSGNWSAPCVSAQAMRRLHCNEGNKENVQQNQRPMKYAAQNIKTAHCRCVSESDVSCKSLSSVGSMDESLYMNDLPLRRRSPSPPALPPKGPALLKKCQEVRGRRSLDSQLTPPPVPPHQRNKNSHPRGAGQEPPKQQSSVTTSDSYLLMSDFQREDPKRPQTTEDVNIPERPRVELRKPPTGQIVQDLGDPYMEMGTVFENEAKFKENQQKKSSPVFARSRTSLTPPSPRRSLKSQVNKPPPIREENYLLMTHIHPTEQPEYIWKTEKADYSPDMSKSKRHHSVDLLPQGNASNISDSSSSSVQSDLCEQGKQSVIAPFTNLKNFQQHTVSTSSIRSSTILHASASTSSLITSNTNIASSSSKSTPTKGGSSSQNIEKSGSENTPKTGFFNRLIRRNSGNRKSMSQSQENLIASSSNESCLDKSAYQSGVKETGFTRGVSQSSNSSTSSISQPQPAVVSEEDPIQDNTSDRQRSLSVPNRSSFIEMKNIDVGLQDSMSLDDQLELLGSEHGSDLSDVSSLNDSFKGKPCYTGPCESTGSENGEEDQEKQSKKAAKKLQMCSESKLSLESPESNRVLTVLHANEMPRKGSDSSSLSKTDDEKLIELLKASSKAYNLQGSDESCNSQALSDEVKRDNKRRYSSPINESSLTRSPKEEASAIAKHVTNLAPFIPAKMKSYLSCPLSPVMETGSMDVNKKVLQHNVSCGAMYSMTSPETPKRLTSRLDPPMIPLAEAVEDIWIPRQPPNSRAGSAEREEDKFLALVVEVTEEFEEQDDNISLSSLDSSVTSTEEGTRCSPASTLLRPRSGKEYKMVERHRTINESQSDISMAPTPKSTSGMSVFTFDTSPSQNSLCYENHRYENTPQTPSVPKLYRADSSTSSKLLERISPPRSYLFDRVSPPKTYINIDMTPPQSPQYQPPLETEPQLNYAEIDLSHTNTSSFRKSLKGRKPSLRSIKPPCNIEYAMIDMEATQAIQRAGREHAINRSDSNSLRRQRPLMLSLRSREQKMSISESSSTNTVSPPPSVVVEKTNSMERERFQHENTPLPQRRESTSSSSSSEVDIDTSSDEDDMTEHEE